MQSFHNSLWTCMTSAGALICLQEILYACIPSISKCLAMQYTCKTQKPWTSIRSGHM